MSSWYIVTHRSFSVEDAASVVIDETHPNDCNVHTDHYCCELIKENKNHLIALIGRIGDKYINGYSYEVGDGGGASPCMAYKTFSSIPLALIDILNQASQRKNFGDKKCDELINKLSPKKKRFIQLEIDW